MSKLKIKKDIADHMHKDKQSIRIVKGKAKIAEDAFWQSHSDYLERRIKKIKP